MMVAAVQASDERAHLDLPLFARGNDRAELEMGRRAGALTKPPAAGRQAAALGALVLSAASTRVRKNSNAGAEKARRQGWINSSTPSGKSVKKFVPRASKLI
jgi:hypothetical protein